MDRTLAVMRSAITAPPPMVLERLLRVKPVCIDGLWVELTSDQRMGPGDAMITVANNSLWIANTLKSKIQTESFS